MERIFILNRRDQNALVALGASLGAAASPFATRFVAQEPNKCFEPTLGNPRAAQTKRSMWKEELEREYRCLVADEEVTVVPVLSLAHGAAPR